MVLTKEVLLSILAVDEEQAQQIKKRLEELVREAGTPYYVKIKDLK